MRPSIGRLRDRAQVRRHRLPTSRKFFLRLFIGERRGDDALPAWVPVHRRRDGVLRRQRSEEHTSELQSLMRTSYAVFCLKKKKTLFEQHCDFREQLYRRLTT